MRKLFPLFMVSFLMWGCPEDPRRKCLQPTDCLLGESCLQGYCAPASNTCTPGQSRPCYTGPEATRGKGTCRDGTESCSANNTWSGECKNEVKPTQEICGDGKDNDCNGVIDDSTPTAEVCDGVDNDCNGKIDDDPATGQALVRTCYTGAQGTAGKGACKSGSQTCKDGKWPDVCDGEIVPKAELCANQIDDDCDGIVDNVQDLGKPCRDPSKQGACQDGLYACDAQGNRICKPTAQTSPEDCNGKDDDCDGKVDNIENTPDPIRRACPTYPGPAGTENVGECKAGVQLCQNGQWNVACSEQVTPQTDVCDGKDNDCDGQIDNQPGSNNKLARACYTGPQGTENVGTCKGGNQQCVNGDWSTCQGQVIPKDELCANNQDEDCDGKVDNVRFLGERCLDRTRKGICQSGIYQCQGANRICKQTVQPETETCNGKDDDCDGQTDNLKGTNTPLERDCYSPGGTPAGNCKRGKQSCSNGIWSAECKGEVTPYTELCNGQDDDCDGKTDEGNACATCANGTSRDCYNGPNSTRKRGSCMDGKELCQGGKWSGTCNNSVVPQVEDCNGQDDDCDGQTDNIPATTYPLRKPCYDGPAGTDGSGLCAGGFNLCLNGQWDTTCTGAVLPKAEICDGKDNDCDGKTDEGSACQTTERKVGESCSNDPTAPAGLKCGFGLQCISATDDDPAPFCYQNCGSAAACANNTDGRILCAPLSNTVSICIAQADEGAFCDVEQSVLCKPGFVCDANTRRCRKPSEAGPLQPCAGSTGYTCDSQHLCTILTTGSRSGFCLKRCNTTADCGTGLCVGITAQDSVCIPAGNRKVDEPCGRADEGPTFDSTRLCQQGLFCLRTDLTNPDGICVPPIQDCSLGCPGGRSCVNIDNGFFCMRPCTAGCLTDTECSQVINSQVCTAKTPPGSVPFGGICDPANRCLQDLACLGANGAVVGYCSKVCTSNANCPNSPPGAKCQTVGAGVSACVFPCTSNANCPTGLICSANDGICLAP
ncbi:MAG: hypothetical protein H6728_08255 [Myxococcales bacterium]|nr:hypothetical protein [Myxococcales bacterium]